MIRILQQQGHRADTDTDGKEHKFWDTQPVPRLGAKHARARAPAHGAGGA